MKLHDQLSSAIFFLVHFQKSFLQECFFQFFCMCFLSLSLPPSLEGGKKTNFFFFFLRLSFWYLQLLELSPYTLSK